MDRVSRHRRWITALRDLGLMMVGAAVLAIGISGLIVPNRLADGGLTGVAIVLHYLTGLPVGPAFAVLNLPLLLWALPTQGRRFLVRTLLGVLLVSAWTTALAGLHLPVHDPLLAALYGGLAIGLGIGLILRSGGSTGGTDIIARFGHRRYGWAFSQAYLAMDVAVLAAVAVWVGLPAAMYAWVATYVSGQVVNYVVEGPRRGRVAFLVSDREERIRERITGELGRGATRLEGTGAWTQRRRPVLMVAVSPQEVVRLRNLVTEEDPSAFLIVLPAAEVVGEGFWRADREQA